MARAYKRRFQFLRNAILAALLSTMAGMVLGGVAEKIAIFMLTGIISGTPYTVPVWGMFALYSGVIIVFLLSYLVDRELERKHLNRIQQRQLPKRRYSHA